MTGARSIVRVANEQVSIFFACRLIGMHLPDDPGYGKSLKVHCPFGEIYHVDQGAEAALRVYPDSNSAWCFACQQYYNPVRMVAAAWDLDQRAAAVELLTRAGIRPVSLAEAFAQARTVESRPDATLLAEALKTYCRRTIPGWADAQFEPVLATALTRCLALLNRVYTETDAERWLGACKQVMTTTASSHALYKANQTSVPLNRT